MSAPLQHLLDPDLSLRVALTLVHFVWQGLLVAGVAAGACALLRRASASARYGVLLAALLVMALCPFLTFALLRPGPHAVAQAQPQAPPAGPAAAEISAPAAEPGANPAVVRSTSPAPAPVAFTETPVPFAPPAPPPMRLGPVPTPWIDANRLKPYAPWLTVGYTAGALFMTGRLLLALRGGRRLRRAARIVIEPSVLASLARQAGRLGLRRVPVVAWCRDVAAPAVVGVVRPTILLPVALSSGMSAAQIESILAHELAHVRRLDPLVNFLQGLIEALLFFHPAVWFVSRRLRAERENCCDDMVLSAGGAPLDYVKSLVRAAELGLLSETSAAPGAAALAAVGRPSQLRHRIVRLLQGEPAPQLRVSPGPFLAVALLAAAVSAGAWYRMARAAPPDDGPAAPTFVGRLVDPEGRAISNGYVGPAGSNLYQGGVRTGPDGVFKLTDVKPDQTRWAAYSQRSRRLALFTVPAQTPADPVDVTLRYRHGEADGRVVDADGVPVKGAKVVLRVTTPQGESYELPAYQDTDEHGAYVAHWVPTGEGVRMVALVGDEATQPVELGRQYTLEMPDLVTKKLKGTPPEKPAPPRVRYSGRVVDEQGKPLAGVELQMYYPVNNMMGSAGRLVTDGDGRFSRLLPAEAHRVDLRLSHPECVGYQFESNRPQPPVEALRNGSAVLVMKRGLSIRGVVKGPDGKPLENAMVMAASSYGATPGPENEPIEDFTSPRTARDGSFRVGGLPAGWLEVMVSADGLAPKIERVEVKPDAPPVEVKLAPGKTYAGRVVDPDGKPVEGASVYASDWRAGNHPRVGANRQATTDADGRFTLRDLPNDGQMRIRLGKRAGGYLSMSHEWSAAGPVADELTIYPKPVVRGRVVDADTGEPVKDFRAAPFWQASPSPLDFNESARGKPDGSFELTIDRVVLSKPAATPFYAEIQARGYAPQLTPPVIAGKAYEPFVIKLQKAEAVTGVVTDADGKPAEGAIVALVKAGGQAYSIDGARFTPFSSEPHPQVKTDTAGKFELPPVGAEGRLLVLHERGYLILPHPGLPPGAKLTLVPWARVEGTARKDGKPLHGVRVALNPGNADSLFGGHINFNLRATTHVNGQFVFDKVPSVPWRVALEPGAGPSVDINPEPGKTTAVNLGGAGKAEVGAVPAPRVPPAPEPAGPAYATLLQAVRAKTVHWKQTDINGYGPDNRKSQTLSHEMWRDVERNFFRDRYTDDVRRDDGRLTNDGESFHDDQFSTVIYHSDRHVYHVRANPLARLAEAREVRADLLHRMGASTPAALRDVEKVGTEQLDGVACDVWSGPMTAGDQRYHFGAWVATTDGRVRKLETVPLDPRERGRRRTIDVVEYDKPFRPDFFRALEIPAGYTQSSPKDAAPARRFSRGFGTSGQYQVELSFTLADGSVVVCWNHFPSGPDPLARHPAFEGLKFGGDLPRLPTLLRRLYSDTGTGPVAGGTDDTRGEIAYAGRHLAVTTTAEGETFEWSLYVPSRPPPPRENLLGYTVEFETQNAVQREKLASDVRLTSDADFNTFVRGAMAQYAADGNVPDKIRPDRVKALVASVRAETAAAGG